MVASKQKDTAYAFMRQHPINILENMWRYILLLAIPILRGFIFYKGGFYAWIRGAWLDITIVIFIFVIGTIRWLSFTFLFSDTDIIIEKGVFFKVRKHIYYKDISTVSVEQSFYYKPFKAVKMHLDTDGGNTKKTDISFTLYRSTAYDIFQKNERIKEVKDQYVKRLYKPKGLYIMAISALLSNSFAGVLFASTFISSTGNVLGEEFKSRIYGTLANIAKQLAFGLPPAAAALGYVVLGGWVIAFIRNIIKHNNFRVVRTKKTLVISGGIITNRDYSVTMDNVNFTDIRQSVLTKILRLYSVFVHCAGYGKTKNDVSVLVPAAGRIELNKTLKLLLPEFYLKRRTLKPNFGALFRYVAFPITLIVLIVLSGVFFSWLLPSWEQFIIFLAFMALFPCTWLLALRITDFCTTGINSDHNFITIRYSKGYYLHTVLIPIEKIAKITLRQSLFQCKDQTCDVIIHSHSEGRIVHRVKNLYLPDVIELLKLHLN